jgi:hypothetical protein
MMPPRVMAVTTYFEVQLEGLPLPTTRFGLDVSTGCAAGGTGAARTVVAVARAGEAPPTIDTSGRAAQGPEGVTHIGHEPPWRRRSGGGQLGPDMRGSFLITSVTRVWSRGQHP